MGRKHTEANRVAISRGLRRYHERRRDAARVRPKALERLKGSGIVAPELAPLLEVAEAEMVELVEALGGRERISPQRLAVLEDAVHVGLVLRAELTRYLTVRKAPDCAARVGSLAGQRRASLALLGLERHVEDALDLREYLARKAAQGRAGDPNGGGSDPSIERAEDARRERVDEAGSLTRED